MESRKPDYLNVFSIDYRSLALFRMAMGLVMLYCVVSVAVVADMFLMPDGVLSEVGLRAYYNGSWAWSINWLSDAAWFQTAILLLATATALSLIVGWHTRWATILAWALITSILNKVQPIVGGGDILLNLLLFWGMFLPLGARWSLDARQGTKPAEESLLSVATAAVLLQMAVMYLFTGFSKCNDVWFSGSALDIGLSNDRLARPLGHILAGYPWLTSLLTRGTLIAELILPLVLFLPWKFSWCRSVALLMLMAFHIGIESSMVVMLFSYSSLAGLLTFVPTEWWQSVPLKKLEGGLNKLFGEKAQQSEPAQKQIENKRHLKRDVRQGLDLKSRFGQTAIVVCILYVLFYNVIVEFASPEIRKSLGTYQRFGEVLALKQYWNMFGDPSSLCHDIACVARLRDGTRIDLLRNNAELDDRKSPPRQPLEYDKTRLMVFTTALTYPENGKHRESFLNYLVRLYEDTNNDSKREIVECYLMYYLFGAHPFAEKTPSAEVTYIRLHGFR
jgi:hypothetical protein